VFLVDVAKLEESASDDCAQAHAEFKDEMDELKAKVSLLKKDTVKEVWREEGMEACARFGGNIDNHLGRILNEIYSKLGGAGLRKLVACEVRRHLTHAHITSL
jgi:ASC-1-like (ASCH) protein